MKPMLNFFLALTVVLAATVNAGEPVLDSDGDIIFNSSYYVLPATVGAAGGGLTFTLGERRSCPLYIGQEDSATDRGIPVKFSNWKSRGRSVPELENLSIKMDTKPDICVESTYWWIDDSYRKSFVGTGPKPEPGEDSKWSYFQIKKARDLPNAYEIMSCPKDNYSFNVSIYVDNRIWYLAINTRPFSLRL